MPSTPELVEGAGFVVLVSSPFVLLLISYYRDSGSIVGAFSALVGMFFVLGMGPMFVGVGLAAVTPEWFLPWVIIIAILSWPLGAVGALALYETAEDRVEARRRQGVYANTSRASSRTRSTGT